MIHEEKNSHFTFHGEKKGPITSHENTLYHPQKKVNQALHSVINESLTELVS